MSTLQNEESVVNVAVADSTLPADSLEPTAAEQKKLNAIEAETQEVVELAISTLDPRDALKKYCKLGRKAWDLQVKVRNAFPGYCKEDYFNQLDKISTLIKMRVPVKELHMDKYVRLAAWVELVKPLVPNVEKLSFYQAVNKFLHTVEFDPVELTAELRAEWIPWLTETLKVQLSDEPLKMAELDKRTANYREFLKLEKARKAKPVDPEKELERERKAAEAAAKKERRQAQTKATDALDEGITNGHIDAIDAVQLLTEVLKNNKMELPAKYAGFDPATCTIEDCRKLATTMAGLGKIVEMKVLRDNLDAMMKIAEHAMNVRVAG